MDKDNFYDILYICKIYIFTYSLKLTSKKERNFGESG